MSSTVVTDLDPHADEQPLPPAPGGATNHGEPIASHPQEGAGAAASGMDVGPVDVATGLPAYTGAPGTVAESTATTDDTLSPQPVQTHANPTDGHVDADKTSSGSAEASSMPAPAPTP